MAPPRQKRRLHGLAFAIPFALLAVLAGWWTVLLTRLVNENHALQLQLGGDRPALQEGYAARRLMLLGETSFMATLGLALVVFAWRASVREKENLRRIEGLLAASTHELKTPVAGLRALLESIESGVLPPDRMGPHLERGLEACTRLEHLIEGILAWQAATGRPQEPESRPLGRWVEPVLAHRLDEGLNEEVEVDLGAAAAVPVLASGDALRVVLENLLDNARKYGEGKPVRVSARAEGDRVHLDIADQGAGFPPSEATTIFEPYQRGTAGSRTHGTGLGLYISRALARNLGGDLRATSPGEGQGATFTLTLRRATDG